MNTTRPDLPGRSRRGMGVVAELERDRFRPGAVATALAARLPERDAKPLRRKLMDLD